MIRKLLSWPIRVQMIILILLLAVPSILFVIHSGIEERGDAIQDARLECLKFVDSIAREQQSVVAGAQQLVAALALIPDVQTGNFPALDAILKNLQNDNPQYANIAITDKSGVVRASAITLAERISSADRRYFQDAARTGKFSSGEYIVGRIISKATINFGYPVKNASQELIAVIYVALDLDFSKHVFQSLALPPGASFSLLDHRGIVLLSGLTGGLSEKRGGERGIEDEIFTSMKEGPEEGTYDWKGNDGDFRLFAYKSVKLPHETNPYLYIQASVPEASVISVANAMMFRRLSILLSIFAVGVFLAWFIGRRAIVNPIEVLKGASQQLAAGAGVVNVSRVVRGGELGELAQSFDCMAEALVQSQRRLSDIIEFLPDATLVIDKDGKVIAWNRAIEAMTGIKAEAMLGRGDHEYAIPFYGERKPILIDLALHHDPGREKQYTAIARTGDSIFGESFVSNLPTGHAHLSATASVLRDAKGNIVAAIECIRDNTERRQAEEALRSSEEQFKAMFETASIGVAQADPRTGQWVRVNQKMCEITGYSYAELLAMRVPEITHPEDRGRDWEAFQQVVRGGAPNYRIEKRYLRKDGGVVWVNVNMTVIRDAPGLPVRTIATIEDITARKRAEEENNALQRRLSEIVDFLPDPMLAIDREKRIIVWNRAMEEMTGIPASEMIGKGDYAYSVPFYGEPKPQLMDLFWAPDHDIARQYPTLRKEDNNLVIEKFCPALYGGKGAYVWAKAVPLFDAGGNLNGSVEIIRDTTQRRLAEETIRDSRRRLYEIIDFLPDATLVLDRDGKVIAWNRAIEAMTGIKAQDMLGKGDHEYALPFYGDRRSILIDLALHPDPERERQYTDILRTGDSVFGESFVPNLPTGHAHLSATAAVLRDAKGEVVAAIECIRDNTERRRAEEELRSSEEQFKAMFETASIGVAQADPRTGQWVRVNQKMCEITGYSYAELLAMRVPEITHPEDRGRDWEAFQQVVCGGAPSYRIENRYLRKDDAVVWVNVNMTVIRDAAGLPVRTIATIEDITERKRMEEELKQSEERFRRVVERAPDAIFVRSQSGHLVYLNQAAVHLFGAGSADQLLGRHILERVDPDWQAVTTQRIGLLNEGQAVSGIEQSFLRMDGSPLSAEVSAVPLRYEGMNGVLVFARDVSERKRAEEESRALQERLARAEKMEALGIMAGGVAHDLNNVMGILVGYSELLLDDIDQSSPLRPHVEYIKQGGERAAAIVQDLLTLARRGVQTKEIVDLNSLIDEFQDSPEFEKICSFHPHVRVETVYSSGLLNIKGSPVHLRKTVMNLVSNAAEAMPAGGKVTIATSNLYLDRPLPGYDDIQEGDYVVLSVGDRGEGISEKDLKKIFEPFYTKKVMGRSGTGLGLSVVWGTVKDHKGYVNVQSEEGKGTTFTLYFPVTREEKSNEHISMPVSEYLGRGESILVVDDVQGQRELAARMLEKLNYRVAAVASGEEAVEYLETHKADLVVLDMIMDPGMDGLDTYRAILKIHPGQKAIIVSGFSESDRVRKAQALGAGAYVRKPYVRENLGIAVKKNLGGSA